MLKSPVNFYFYDTAATEIYTLSLHDALPIFLRRALARVPGLASQKPVGRRRRWAWAPRDRKSTRLNSSHGSISYAVFCLKRKIGDRTERYQFRQAWRVDWCSENSQIDE